MTEKQESREVLYWKCAHCAHVVEGDQPPERCPACMEKCSFRNVTCYTPECGGKGIDPKLVK